MKLVDEILDGLRMQGTVFSRMTLAGDWGFANDSVSGAPFHLVLSGRACLLIEDGQVAHSLEAGDIVILPLGVRHRLLAHPDARSVPWRQVLDHMGWTHWIPGMHCKTADLNYGSGEPVTTLISGMFAFGDHRRNPLLSVLPIMLLVRSRDDSEAAHSVRSITALLDAELLSGKPGAESVAVRLAELLFIQVVRHYLSATEVLPAGWLRGIADLELAPAVALIHRAPEKAWSVEMLAREAGMSRSRFAARFQEVIGQSPLEYLTQWRMYQAACRLAAGRIMLSALAASVGYRSDVGFSKAFKRWAGQSPAQYRRSLLPTVRAADPD
jgi:AraC-like DNA-binding protein